MSRKSLLELDRDSADGAPAWAVSYGDLMSLLLTLFVMLVSMSEIKQNDKFQGVADSLHEQFRFDPGSGGGLAGDLLRRSAPLAVLAVSGREARRRVMRVAESGQDSQLRSDSAIAVRFDPVTSELAADAQQQLSELANVNAGKQYRIEVRGLAPSPAEFELAWQRAKLAASFLAEEARIEPTRLRIQVFVAARKIATAGPGEAAEKPMVEVFVQDEPQSLAARPAPFR